MKSILFTGRAGYEGSKTAEKAKSHFDLTTTAQNRNNLVKDPIRLPEKIDRERNASMAPARPPITTTPAQKRGASDDSEKAKMARTTWTG